MLPTDAMQMLRYYSEKHSGLRTFYPAPGNVVTPCLCLFWDETDITEMREQYWMMTVKGQILMALRGNPDGEIKIADTLIAPLVDAFSANNPDRSAFTLRSHDGTQGVDHCRITRVIPSLAIEYAKQNFYGSEVYWGIKLRRHYGST